MSTNLPPAPRAEEAPVTVETHGHRRQDPYAWLRDADWREAMRDPDRLAEPIRAHLEAENTYADAVMAPTRRFRERLFRELRGRIREDDSSVPMRDGAFHYYGRYREGGQHPVLCRRHGSEDAPEEVLLDGDREADGASYFRLGAAEHAPDHRRLAYAVDTTGAESWVLRFRDLDTGTDLPERISDARGDFEWSADARSVFYTVLDAEHRPKWVYRHVLGDDPADDGLVYEEPDDGFFVDVDKTESGRFIVITSHDHVTTELRVIPAAEPDAAPRLLLPREPGVEYAASDHGEHWILLTNRDAEDFRVVTAPLDAPAPEHWRDLVPHRPGHLIQDLLLFRDYLVRLEIADALPAIVVRRLADGTEHPVAFDQACYDLGMIAGFEFDTTTLRLSYSSFSTPARVIDYDMATGTQRLRKEQEIPSGHDPDAYVIQRLHATAPDGEQVPVSLFHHRDVTPDPETPLLLYGYGSYGMIDLPGFSPLRLSLVNRGFVYAVAHVRGGKDRGDRWYRDGKLERKTNTFSDYIAAAEGLIAAGYTGAGRITAHGGSAGGMLVGAAVNQRPELFHAAVADVPFVDVLNTMLDASLPLTPPEWPEWGNPAADEAAYYTILSYSPYDNVRAQAYPHLLVTAGVSDPRVTYWEPAKWVARLRTLKTDDHLLLLRTNMSAGHGGPGGRFDFLEEVAYRYAFILMVYGFEEATTA
ncbi:S9 family peptidase [Aquisalimonas lutea]|uniref:S9 family peptidase n=1 Tax=Aquisalimonas lutea TaxID=1327750 RepID=UPI0025B4667B|nr:S9 family peptidase [Aquisalimonas lutea]MDN3517303.1 S9 family peptidase [Aquisalimonas lutea]